MTTAVVRTAFILGAGLGTRLRPLTEHCPKPLLPVGGRPLITYAMDHCLGLGVRRFIVNTHHCAAAYDRAFPERSWRGWPVLFRHEPVLLDTAGGLQNIADLLDPGETLLVYNGDIVADLPLAPLLKAHTSGDAEVTLALRSQGPLCNVCVDAAGNVVDLRDTLGSPGVRRCQFTGIWLAGPRFRERLVAGRIESVVPVFVRMIRERPGSVAGVVIDEGDWEDIGDPEAYSRVREGLPQGPVTEAAAAAAPDRPGQPLAAPAAQSAGTLIPEGAGIQAGTGSRSQSGMTAEDEFSGGSHTPAAAEGAGRGSGTGTPPPRCGRQAGQEASPGDSATVTPDIMAGYVREALGLPPAAPVGLAPVGRGGSDRDYFRVRAGDNQPRILMRYQRLREENGYYAAIAGFLDEIGVTVPEILGHDPARGLLLMEDLGDADLYGLRHAPWEERCRLYEKTLSLAAKLHAFPADRFPGASVPLMPGFSPELYRWERDYFREQCVVKACGILLASEEAQALEEELAGLATHLIRTPRTLVHRDFQSQNVMIRNGEPVLIDFQGMRWGNPFYDLASLLYDPYVSFPEAGREELLRAYHATSACGSPWATFREDFLAAAAQRLMQALGAYGFLGIEKGKAHFLAHIPAALESLIAVTGEASGLAGLHALARRCRTAAD